MMTTLSGIREAMLLYAPRGRGKTRSPKPTWQIEDMDENQTKLYDLLSLELFATQ
jgi:hypothetical protein